MILHRYMSEREFEAYTKGKTMRNDTKHGESAKTTSVGFCFFPEEPEEAHRWLRGIVCDDVCVTFDVPENMVKKSVGTYNDPDKSDNSIGAVLMDISPLHGKRDGECRIYGESRVLLQEVFTQGLQAGEVHLQREVPRAQTAVGRMGATERGTARRDAVARYADIGQRHAGVLSSA